MRKFFLKFSKSDHSIHYAYRLRRTNAMASSLSWIFIGILTVVVYCICEAIYRYKVTTRGKKKIPTKTPLPFVGNLLHFFKDRTAEGLFKAMDSYLPSCQISGVWFGPKLLIMITDANFTESLMTKGFASRKADEMYGIFDPVMSGIFVTRDLKRWSKLRKPLEKLMLPKWADYWIDQFRKNVEKLCQTIAENPRNVNLESVVFSYAAANLCETHLGIPDSSKLNVDFNKVLHDMNLFVDMSVLRAWDLTARSYTLFKMTEKFKIFRAIVNRLYKSVTEIYKEREAHLEKENLVLDDSSFYTDILLEYSRQNNLEESDTLKLGMDFMGAGAHTTTNALSSALLFLSMHPDCQQKLYEEVTQVWSDLSVAPTEEQLNQLTYLDMIAKESLRHVGASGVARRLDKDFEAGDFVIPKGSILWFNFLNLNRNPKYWERPYEFYPEHFTPEAIAKRPKGAYLPFSLGARGCVGKRYAEMEIRVALSILIQKFKFTCSRNFEDIQFRTNVMRSPTDWTCDAVSRIPASG